MPDVLESSLDAIVAQMGVLDREVPASALMVFMSPTRVEGEDFGLYVHLLGTSRR